MPTKTIDLSNKGPVAGFPQAKVYTKTNWNSDWIESPNVIAKEAVYRIAPGTSVATLEYRFGTVAVPGQFEPAVLLPLDETRYYVLIVNTGEDGSPFHWIGYSESPIVTKRYPSESGGIQNGVQDVPCYGLDRMLQYAWIDSSIIRNPDVAANQKWLRKAGAPHFNPKQKGNRTEDKIELQDNVEQYLLEKPNIWFNFWSTRDIIEYLVRFYLPTNDYGIGVIPWAVSPDISMIPNWDRPTIDMKGMTCWDAINELLSPDKMLGWYVEPYVENPTNFFGQQTPIVRNVYIRPFSRLASALTLPSVGSMPANTNRVVWITGGDQFTDGELQFDDSDRVDQVIVQGPREIGVGTFEYEKEYEPGWFEFADEPRYETAKSQDPSWAGLKQWEKTEWNTYYRDLPFLANVFRRYSFLEDWDGTCGGDPLFQEIPPTDTDGDGDPDGQPKTYIPYLGAVELLENLPLYRGINYEGDPTAIEEKEGLQNLPILAFIERPRAPGTYAIVQNAWTVFGSPPMRNPNTLPYSVKITADNEEGPAFNIDMAGAPRHALAGARFTPNDGDPEKINPKIWGEFDIEKLLITAAMRGDRRPEWKIPATVNREFVKRKIIKLEHAGLQHVHIAAETVVGVDHTGDRIYSQGGVLRDPLPYLRSLCLIAAQNLIEPRKSLSIRSGRVFGSVRLGDLIETYDGTTANVLVNEIRLTTPIAESDSPPPAMMTITASTNFVDIVALIGRVPEPESKTK